MVRRRLAAIMALDMVGYSRLVGLDETGTIERQKACRRELIEPAIERHGGRVVQTAGEGLLAEFASAVAAVVCAADIQRAVAEREAATPDDRRLSFRIGVNLGDIVEDGSDVLGDGVNIAARLEALAEPGGIAISGAVHTEVRDRLDLALADAGERTVKNIRHPVRVWRWTPEAATAGGATGTPSRAFDRPAIAVLPFDNLSGDPDQEYFADGLAEDLITAFSCMHNLPVIARSSGFSYNPYFAHAHLALGNRRDLAGESEAGIAGMRRALELNPRDPSRGQYMLFLARALTVRGEHEEAAGWVEAAAQLDPGNPDVHYRHAVCLANLDRVEAARAALARCAELRPDFIEKRRSWRPYNDEPHNERFFAGMRRHGLMP